MDDNRNPLYAKLVELFSPSVLMQKKISEKFLGPHYFFFFYEQALKDFNKPRSCCIEFYCIPKSQLILRMVEWLTYPQVKVPDIKAVDMHV